jgi:MFS family permease
VSESIRTSKAQVDVGAVYAKIKWRILPFLMLCYVVAFLDRTNVGVAKLGFAPDLGFDDAAYGMGAGLFYLGYILLEIPSNLWLARVGIRKTLLRIMIVWGACCAALAFMSTPWEYFLLRTLLGCAEAGLFPGILLYLTYWIPSARRASVTALFMASIPISGVVGGPLAALIMRALGNWHHFAGWRWLFIAEGVPAILLGMVAYFYLKEGPASAPWLTPDEIKVVLADLERERMTRRAGRNVHESLRAATLDPQFVAIAALGFALMVSTAGSFLWLPSIIHRSGVTSVSEVGLLSALPFGVGLVAQFMVAAHSDRSCERRWHAVIPAALGAIGWALLPLASGPVPALALLILATSGTLAAMGPYWMLPTLYLSEASVAGGIALVTTIAGFGNFISPILVGELSRATGSLASGQEYFAGVMLLGAALLLGAAPREKRDDSSATDRSATSSARSQR